MTKDSYQCIKWGVLLSGCHMVVANSYQIIPSFIGYFLIWYGIKNLCKQNCEQYYGKVLNDAKLVLILSIVGWIGGIFFGYVMVLPLACQICFYLIEVLLYGNLLNMTVKLLKENNRIREADRFRKNRVTFLKVYLGIIALHCVQLIGQALKIEAVVFLNYTLLTFMLVAKMWMSVFMQDMAKYEITIDNSRVDNE